MSVQPMDDTHELGPDHTGRALAARVGDTVVLRLPENPTTGVRWQADDAWPDAVELVDDRYGSQETDAIGESNIRILTLRLLKAGSVALNLSRMQAWEGPESADARFSVTIDVVF